jgi:hypothetical protein
MKRIRALGAGIGLCAGMVLAAGCSAGGSSSPPAPNGPAPAPTAVPTATPIGASTPTPTPSPSASPSSSATPTQPSTGTQPSIGGCTIFPANNPWNTDISSYPVNANSAGYLSVMNAGGSVYLHPDFGSNPSYGIPYNVDAIEPAQYTPISFTPYASQSDPGPYPIPSSPAIEAGSDRHMLILDTDDCTDYETYDTQLTASGWTAESGAVWPLDTNTLRPEGWTSADAAGLPILAGLIRYDEVQAGAVNHAIRFTVNDTSQGHIHPATHDAATSSDPNAPPMGLRIRLKASYNIGSFTGNSLVILRAMKKYGLMLADNGSNFYFQGSTDTRWNDNDLNQLKSVPASAFEVVDTGPVITP